MSPEEPLTTKTNDTFYQTVLDAIPIPVFVVDSDVQIRDLNAAAVSLLGLGKDAVHRRRGGDVLHCLHATDVEEGCGRGPACKTCDIRTSVTLGLEEGRVTRKRVNLQVRRDGDHVDVHVLMTVSPMPEAEERLALLMLEDITLINHRQTLIPMCMQCRKVCDDEHRWRDVHGYFQEHAGVDFSHGLCPTCLKDFKV